MYLANEISKEVSEISVKNIQSAIHHLFEDLREEYDGNVEMQIIIDDLEQITTSDPEAFYKVYKDLKKYENK